MENIYAQLNDENVCIGLSQLTGEVNKSYMIRLAEYDINLLGKKYENGEWLEVV